MWTTIGHPWAIDLLSRAIAARRLAHAYLFTGPERVGKSHLARELAAAVNCLGDEAPCGTCASCVRIAAGTHPDVSVVAPEGGRLKIEQVRALQRAVALAPFEARWRVCLLCDVHLATREAANALLKTLEEPPGRVLLLLTATDATLLPPTIVSRCQVVPLRGVAEATLADALVGRLGADRATAQLVARLSAGRVGWAMEAVRNGALLEQRRRLLDDMVAMLPMGPAERLQASERLSRRDDVAAISQLWQTWWRDVVLICAGCEHLVVGRDRTDTLRAVAQSAGIAAAQAALAASAELGRQLDRNVNVRLALDVLLLRWPQVRLPAAA